MTDFLSMVKSTIDKAGVDIAQAYDPTIGYVDLTDQVKVQELLGSNRAAVVWEMLTLVEDPIHPLYEMNFGIGAKTTGDPGNYAMTEMLDAVRAVMAKGDSIVVRDYSPGGDGVTDQGYVYITDVSVDPQLFDKVSGIRLIGVSGKVVANG